MSTLKEIAAFILTCWALCILLALVVIVGAAPVWLVLYLGCH